MKELLRRDCGALCYVIWRALGNPLKSQSTLAPSARTAGAFNGSGRVELNDQPENGAASRIERAGPNPQS